MNLENLLPAKCTALTVPLSLKLGSVIIALNGPTEESVGQIREFQKLFLAVGFIVFGSIMIVASIVIAAFVAPRSEPYLF